MSGAVDHTATARNGIGQIGCAWKRLCCPQTVGPGVAGTPGCGPVAVVMQ